MKKNLTMLVFALFVIGGMATQAATLNVAQDGSGDFDTIQAAIDAAAEGDVIIIHEGSYNEDPSIGTLNMPPAKKNQLTIQAAEGADVEVVIANSSNRMGSLSGIGADFGESDLMGFLVYGDGVVIDGLRIVQNDSPLNNMDINVSMTVISSDVTIRNCEFVGPGPEEEGDLVGLAITPLDAVTLSQGGNALATNLTVEDCEFTNWPFAAATANFLLELGLEAPSPSSTYINCAFSGNGSGIEVDDGTLAVEGSEFDSNGIGLGIGDGEVTLTDCTILNSLENGVEVAEDELEDNDTEQPNVTIQDCMILNNGETEDHHSLIMECGVLTVNNTVMANSVGSQVYFETYSDRPSTATFVHCDLYQSLIGVGVGTTMEPDDIITATFTNTNIVDADGVINDAGFIAEFTLEYCNVFASNMQFGGETETITTSDILNTDPLYVDPDNNDFHLQDGSPVASAGADGTFIGALGLATEVEDWMVR